MTQKPSKPLSRARKTPRQARAQATVQAILDATVRIFDREGESAATTTRIAEVAGVSVGTLYQYFPHRDAILDALQEREFARAIDLMATILSEGNLQKSPREIVTAAVRGLAELYASCPGLHRVLAIEGLRVAQAEQVHAFDARIIGIVRHFLEALGARGTGVDVRRPDLDAASFVVFQCVRAVMLAFLFERPQPLPNDMTVAAGQRARNQVIVEEVVDLLLRYLVA